MWAVDLASVFVCTNTNMIVSDVFIFVLFCIGFWWDLIQFDYTFISVQANTIVQHSFIIIIILIICIYRNWIYTLSCHISHTRARKRINTHIQEHTHTHTHTHCEFSSTVLRLCVWETAWRILCMKSHYKTPRVCLVISAIYCLSSALEWI